MAEIINFIKKYDNNGIDVFLKKDALWPNVKQSRQLLLNMSEEERKHVYEALHQIIKALQDKRISLLNQQKALKGKMQLSEKNRNACIAYIEQAQKLQTQIKKERR